MSETKVQAANLGGMVDIARLLDEHRFTWRQVLIVAFCGLFLMADGYDSMQLAYVAPSLIRQWHIAPSSLGWLFSASGISAILGALIFGPMADRYGRRIVLVGGALLMGVASLGGAWSESYTQFFTWRVISGLGIGVVMPTAIALGAEYAPTRVRSFTVTVFYCGYALGASIGAGLAARIIPVYGWQMVLFVGGMVPIIIALLSLPLVPESIRFLVLRQEKKDQVLRELRRIEPAWQFDADTRFVSSDATSTRSPVRDLFANGRTPMTLLVWVVYVASLIQIFFLSSWVPTLAQRSGVDAHVSLDAVMIMQIGAIVGGMVAGIGIDRWRAAALIPAYLIGVIAVASFGSALSAGQGGIFAAAFCMGVGVMGAQNGMNGLASRLYPTFMRSTGVSAAIGVGRIGSVTGPLIGGAMIAWGLPATTMFLIAAVPAVCALLAVIGLWLWDCKQPRSQQSAGAAQEGRADASQVERVA